MRAWLTPDTIPDLATCQAVKVPDDPAWHAAFRGAILLLCEEHNWEKFGIQTPAEVAAKWWEIFLAMGECYGVVGQVVTLAYQDSSPDLLQCDGSEYSPADYPALFARIGYQFGSGSGDNFRVPHLSCRSVVAVGSATGLTTRALGDKGGAETVGLTEYQMPNHTHKIHGHYTTAAAPGALLVSAPDPIGDYSQGTGGTEKHPNMHPFIALYAYIVAK